MASVQLYVYDLSNGMARQLSRQLTGRQIDGIWHTSVVVFGKEVFYGQGISITQPGRSHHGQPLQIINMGETALDEDTFNDYLEEMRTHYTADKYHLLDFNCNSFTDDCVGFLTGRSIPSYVKDLPNDFLSTPFGAALRPTIDSMFRGPSPGVATPPVASSQDPQLATSILQSVASQAQSQPGPSAQATSSLTGSLHIITNPASFNHFLKVHRAAVALFTAPKTCPPCRVIEPVFDRLAEEKGIREGRNGAAFAKIDIQVGLGQSLAAEWGIRATPTFIFFLDGKKVEEMKGADSNELKTQVDLLLFQAFPPHPHTSLSLPAIETLSLNAILSAQVPALDIVLSKQISFLEEQTKWPNTGYSKDQVKSTLSEVVTTYLKPRFAPTGAAKANGRVPPAVVTLEAWLQATAAMAASLPVESLFPVADLWRLAILDPSVASWIVSHPPSNSSDPMEILLPKAVLALDASSKGARNFSLIMLRFLCNSLSHTSLANRLLRTELRDQLTAVLVGSLLHSDATVRTASASLTFNAAAVLQRERVDAVKSGRGIQSELEEDLVDWHIEVITAVVEALNRENENEEVVHRLAASLAFFLRLSPHYEAQIRPLLEVLQARQTLKEKLGKGPGWNKDGGLAKKDVRRLVEEVADKLCY